MRPRGTPPDRRHWFSGHRPGTDHYGMFAVPRNYLVADGLARWHVQAGDLIGFTGDAGYSEEPRLHYAITRKADGARLCPTGEAGFADAGWIWK